MATHTPHVGKAGVVETTVLHSKCALYVSYVIGARLPKGLLPEALFWDTGDPYYYLRIDSHGDYDHAIFGGEDHKTGQAADTEACFNRLEKAFTQIVPDATITERWSGQVVETNDGLPYIGEIAPRQFVATGFAGNGMTFGTLSAMLACDAALGRTNPWAGLFDVGRTKIRGGAWDYIKENKDYAYYILRDRFTGAEAKSLDSVKPGTGRIVEIDGEFVAASRSDDGTLTVVSSICTHMGCRVDWNEAEHTWDCPCHGSRFKMTGEVIAGPAEFPLKPADIESRALPHR
jgi:nitrite reductase/ring-hydroxylating ferredoxin subunit